MKLIIIFIVTTLTCCNNLEEINLLPDDITPPVLVSLNVLTSDTIEIKSNENINLIVESYISKENIQISEILIITGSVIIIFESDLIPSVEYCSEFRIEDEHHNSLSFIAKFYGFNPRVPELLINEFICKGTKTNPNKVELYVVSDGNLAGVTLFNGVKEDYDSIYTFPSIDVSKGDYIVFRTTSDKYLTAYTEIENLYINNDNKFIDGVRDIRVDDFRFSTTNGVISLYSEPFGFILDTVIYSKNENDIEKNNRNFGLKKTMYRVDYVSETKEWIGELETLFPEDCIYNGDSTTTRSMNRKKGIDTNTNKDWYTTQSRKASFGYENSKLVY